jgi:glucose-1-phosphate cytidylyltransferase
MNKKKNKILKPTTAVILCGGRGSRLGVLGDKMPKTLVKVNNKEILWYILNHLKVQGFTDVILPLGYKGGVIKKFLKKNKNFNLNIKAINTGIKTEIGKRLSLIKNEIKSKNFLLLNGDAIFRFNLKNIYKTHCKKNLGVTFISGEFTYAYGTIGVKNNKIIDFKRNLIFQSLNIRNGKKYQAFNFTGMSIVKTELLEKFDKFIKNSKNFEQEFYPRIIRKFRTELVKVNEFWHSVDSIKDLDILNNSSEKNQKLKRLKSLENFLKKNFLKFTKI